MRYISYIRCKNDCSVTLLNFAIWHWNRFLNKCDYVIYHFHVHFSFYFCFANYLLLAVYFTLILNYEMMLDKKQIRVTFFNWSSKRFVKQSRQLATSIMHLAQELLMNGQCSGGSRSFAKEMRTLKMRSVVAGHRKLTTTNWEQSSKLILHEKLPKNSMSTIL